MDKRKELASNFEDAINKTLSCDENIRQEGRDELQNFRQFAFETIVFFYSL